ncbi:MAG: acyl-CoA dehydrogenase family protein [Gammaproteobacteria bacterium]|nr:acyl-CoA dehydrogenase family protein [Gammaproteobacteria bacterium]MBI5615047.1 acyl-CoA dehydrogenase family protein [Gammaproteobacteria bacterium]
MNIENLRFPRFELPAELEDLRREVRDFLATALAPYSQLVRSNTWDGFDPEFSRQLGERGWLGMTLPKAYGGHERSALERYVVVEEVLAAGAPVGFHWIGDRQSGPVIARYGTEEQKQHILPRIARGEVCFCIGMSEPNSGSDLASVRTRAERVADGWLVNGTKIWTTNAHRADYMIALLRTDSSPESKHKGLSQFLIDLKHVRGITPRPIQDLSGRRHFNEVSFVDALLPADALLGREGDGWKQVTAELAFERSGPERYLSCFLILTQLIEAVRDQASPATLARIGAEVAWAVTLRNMSLSVAGMLTAGIDPGLQASIVKDLGCQFEQRLPGVAQELVALEPTLAGSGSDYQQVLGNLMQLAPSFSLRGGTLEILRGIIARGLGVR